MCRQDILCTSNPPVPTFFNTIVRVVLREEQSLKQKNKLSGTSSFCPFGKILRVLLVQIILGSDYSGSVKNLQ